MWDIFTGRAVFEFKGEENAGDRSNLDPVDGISVVEIDKSGKRFAYLIECLRGSEREREGGMKVEMHCWRGSGREGRKEVEMHCWRRSGREGRKEVEMHCWRRSGREGGMEVEMHCWRRSGREGGKEVDGEEMGRGREVKVNCIILQAGDWHSERTIEVVELQQWPLHQDP